MKHITEYSHPLARSARSLLSIGMLAVLATAIASAESFEMPKDTPFDPNPAAKNSKTNEVLTYGIDRAQPPKEIPLKTVRITNNSGRTIFPLMRDPNSARIAELDQAGNPLMGPDGKPKLSNIGLYNPWDAPDKEYRGYIGYEENGKYFFGLKDGESILVSIPLVFWNGARIGLGTDGEYLTPSGGDANPYKYDPNAKRAIAPAEASKDTIKNGVVMWYRAEQAESPNDDTEDQLAEWTIRDHNYLVSPGVTAATRKQIPDNELVTLINYDVSNVDSLFLPVAMQVLDAWVLPQSTGLGENPNRNTWKAGSIPDIYGWTGAIIDIATLQREIREFTRTENNVYLGQYFGGRGWPFYNFPNVITDPNVPIKIPSGANIFPQSSLKGSGDRSSYDNDKYLLSSGGTGAIAVTIATEGDQSGLKANQVRLSQNEPKAKIDAIQVGNTATANPPPDKPNAIPAGATVTGADSEKRVVTLSGLKTDVSIEGSSVTFGRPKGDYAAEALIRLWYSWAEYFRKHWKDATPGAPTTRTEVIGSMEERSATLNFSKPQPNLVEGMAVDGPGLTDAMTEVERHQGDAVILRMSSDKTSALLSQVANKASTNQPFFVRPPEKLLWTPTQQGDPGYPLLNFSFSAKEMMPNDPKNPQNSRNPFEFSRAVYLAMASMNQIGRPNNDNVFKFMQDIVGANMGFIFDQKGKDSNAGQMVMAEIRDIIKSILRGVSDFTRFPDILDDKGNHIQWYPHPAEKAGGQPFNVFNLDPFVWFVHVKLGFSGYGFSIDDDTADVGAGGAENLQISVGGPGGLKNEAAWAIQAPFGPLKDVECTYSGPDETASAWDAIASVEVTKDQRMKVTTTGQHNLQNGELIVIEQVQGNPDANGKFQVGHATQYTFELLNAETGEPVKPSTPAAKATPGTGRWGAPPRPYLITGKDLSRVFYRVDGDDAQRTFRGAIVTVGQDTKARGKEVRIWRRGSTDNGQLILSEELTDSSGKPLKAGSYKFTFTGGE